MLENMFLLQRLKRHYQIVLYNMIHKVGQRYQLHHLQLLLYELLF